VKIDPMASPMRDSAGPNPKTAWYDPISFVVYDIAVTLTAVVVVLSNQMENAIGWSLIVLGILVDVNRLRFFKLPSTGAAFPVSIFIPPKAIAGICFGTAVVLLTCYLLFPHACWHGLVDWAGTNMPTTVERFESPSAVCKTPHGSTIVLTQIVLAALTILMVAMPVTSVRFDRTRFLRETSLRVKLRLGPMKRWAMLGALLYGLLAYISQATIPFGDSADNIKTHVTPQDSIGYLVWLSIIYMGYFFFYLMAEHRLRLEDSSE
jgi:hypothetical protein